MTGNTALIGPSANPAQTHNRPETRGYEAARDINARAAATGSADAPDARKAIDRLNQVLNSGEPLDRGVFRGTYLDIRA